ncbi:MAG: DinB family protein [Candidatus Dormibacteraeota bacterium]|nr:DinB family protein [Candidatus Dormibacteraeota bacterium]
MDAATRRQLIEEYREGPAVLEAAIRAVPEADLDHAVEGWTPRQVAHHVADSEMTSAIRIRRLLAEERPQLAAYDEELFARQLHYSERPVDGSLEAVRGARASTLALLEVLSEDEWAREGTHSESGRYSVTDWLRIYAAHCHDHADQVRRALRDPLEG